MSEKRIYELTAQDKLNSDDYFAVDKSGNTTAKKVPGSVIVDQFADMNNILGAKNLLPNNAVTVVLRGITWTINSDGTINANGTATGGDSTLYYVSSTNDATVGITIPAGKYTYSCLTTEGSDSTFRSEIYNLTNPSRIGWDYGQGVAFTRSADTKVLGSINIRSGATVSNITFKPMLRPAAVDNSYVPFAKTNKQLTEDVTNLNSDITAEWISFGFKAVTGITSWQKAPMCRKLKNYYNIIALAIIDTSAANINMTLPDVITAQLDLYSSQSSHDENCGFALNYASGASQMASLYVNNLGVVTAKMFEASKYTYLDLNVMIPIK